MRPIARRPMAKPFLVVLTVGCLAGTSLAQPLPERSTPAQQALQLARRAESKAAAGDWAAAVALYEAAVAQDAANPDLRRGWLLAKRQAGALTDTEQGQLAALQELEQTQADALLAQLRLAVLAARVAADANQPQAAYDHAVAGQKLLAQAPADLDVTQYRKALDRAVADARRAGAKADDRKADAAASPPADAPAALPAAPPVAAAPVPAGSRAVAAQAAALESAWTQSLTVDAAAYSPATAIIDTRAILAADDARYRFEDAQITAYRAADAWQLTGNAAARVTQPGLVSYPADWAQRATARQAYAAGQVMRGPTFTGPDGQPYYMAVYDVADLSYQAPYFVAPYFQSLRDTVQADASMDALRLRSQIFGGYASDLAQGLPLLAAFGGISDQFAAPMPDPSNDALLAMLQQFVTPQAVPPPGAAPAPPPAPNLPPQPMGP